MKEKIKLFLGAIYIGCFILTVVLTVMGCESLARIFFAINIGMTFIFAPIALIYGAIKLLE